MASTEGMLRMGGWYYGDPRCSGRASSRGSIILSSGTQWWQAPIRLRERRPDLKRAMLARDRRSRRLVRVIDRLPSGIGRRVMILFTGRHDYVGFRLQVRLETIPTGSYDIGTMDRTTRGAFLTDTDFVLLVT